MNNPEGPDMLDSDVAAFLDAPRFGVLATLNQDGSAQLSVVWYELHRDGPHLLVNTLVGRAKDGNLQRDPRFGLCVEDGYRFVTLNGMATVAADDQPTAKADILRLGIRYDGQTEAQRQIRDLWSTQTRVTYHLHIERVSAIGF